MSNERYTVTNRIQSRGNPPVEMNWLRNGSPAEAISAVASIIAQGDDKDSSVPASIRPKLLGITVTRTPESTPPWADEGDESLPGDDMPTIAEDATEGTAESFRLAMQRNRLVAGGDAGDPYPCAFCGDPKDSLILSAIHDIEAHLPTMTAAELDGALDYIREAGKRFQNA